MYLACGTRGSTGNEKCGHRFSRSSAQWESERDVEIGVGWDDAERGEERLNEETDRRRFARDAERSKEIVLMIV